MKLVITIDCENDAFAEATGYELAMILRDIAQDLEHEDADSLAQFEPIPITDHNGNTIGKAEFVD